MPKTNTRFIWVDIAKGIAILTVILYHTGFLPFQYQLLPLFTPWMLPIFLIVHGILLYKKPEQPMTTIIKKRVVSLIVPYVLFGTITYLLWFFLRWYAPDSVLFQPWYIPLHNFFIGKGLVFNGPLWFLLAYFTSCTVTDLVWKHIKKLDSFFLIVLSILFTYVSTHINANRVELSFSYDLSILFMGFILIGIYLGRVTVYVSMKKIWIPLLILFCLCSFYNGTIDIFGRQYSDWFIFWLSATIGTLLILKVSIHLMSIKNISTFFSYIGEHSISFYVIHWPTMQVVTFLLSIMGIVSFLSGKPTYASFSYVVSNKYIFTIVEIVLLILYTIACLFTGNMLVKKREYLVRK